MPSAITILGDIKAKIASIEMKLEGIEARAQKPDAKPDIKAAYRETGEAVKQLAALEEHLKSLLNRAESPRVSQDDSKMMIRSFVESMRKDTLGSSTYLAAGWNQICTGEFDKAIDSLSNAVKLNPNDTKALGLLGWAYSYLNHYDEALTVCLKVLQLEPDNDAVRNNLGFVCLKKGIYGEAIEHLSRVIKTGRDRTAVFYAHYYMGLVYLERGMLDDAVFFFSKAIVLGPNLIEAYYHLGLVYGMKEMTGAALKEWKKCITLSPYNWWAKKAGEQIEQLGPEEG